MRLRITKQILSKYPQLSVGIIICKGINNTSKDKEISALLNEVENFIRQDFVPRSIAGHSLISPWRAAYSDLGVHASRYHCSTESLIRKILKDKHIPHINKLVDLYNYLSLKYIIPLGADDIDKIKGDIQLTKAKGDELFVPLKAKRKEHPDKGEVVYKDDKEILCRRWNWKESEGTRVRAKTKNAIIYIEGLFPVTKEKVEAIAKEFISLAKVSLKGKYQYVVLDKNKAEVEF